MTQTITRRSLLAGLAALPVAAQAKSRDPLFSAADFRGGLDASHYCVVPDALGASGVSAEFDEDNLGGTSYRLKISIGR